MFLQALVQFDLPVKPLLKFEGNIVDDRQLGILFSLSDYLELVDVTGKIVREDKSGAIPLHLPPILDRLNIDRSEWIANATEFEKIYPSKFARKRRRLKNTA